MESGLLISDNVLLSDHTTIGLGGPATHFATCESIEQLRQCLEIANAQRWAVQLLGGGSNVIFSDEGYKGLVLKVALRGISVVGDGQWVEVTAASGETWDGLVKFCISRDLAGIECLSGIPGLTGATPIQNVGAYGQEVGDTLVRLNALDSGTMETVEFQGTECEFAYRQSRFKSRDNGRYIITGVTYRLQKHARPEIRYPELARFIESHVDLNTLESGQPVLQAIRDAVLALRSRKSMVIDPADPHSRSVGSFFTNPILNHDEYDQLEERWRRSGGTTPIPTFPTGGNIKIPAAWLVEQSGFHKGYRMGGVGISANHALALVNYCGSTHQILALAAAIEQRVAERFNIQLVREPVVITS